MEDDRGAGQGADRSVAPIVSMRGIVKRFGGAVALGGVDLDAHAGEVLAIVGDNGAGKSTLIKILTGVLKPTEGRILVDGEAVALNGRSHAIELGIDAVYQTLALAGDLTPAANIFYGNELTKSVLGIPILDNARMQDEAAKVLFERFGTRLPDMYAPTDSLSGGQRQAVAIARAIYHADLRVLVMDEPTAALGPQETARTLTLIKALREQGLAVLLISHSLDDVFDVADRIQIMRRGQRVGVVRVDETTTEDVLGMIVGAKAEGAAA
ncbi:ATP-binding cassette domain-containing protein [Marinovum sp. 2_MG-2023]|uniref:ATP-binding cassette domain-containing protein n=1 Tax=unclassified Marinovum TaxID=2647166 RepID=UPI0026E161D7|nr:MULTISPECIES: ATP-binding cassette domain-containing protein [unclassified Marinovum]MDO6729274.1 ATP-binding cassette domain-containing protein [Marinovum sp. 2_MG-2023]MDO6779099.1 ATP-binding cassette domain-containing protein [Marinovum sp. 1_MG-2023]